jgi:hypothetical protein
MHIQIFDKKIIFVTFEFLTAGIISAAILWDIASCSEHANRRFGGSYNLHRQGRILAEPNHLLHARSFFS